MREDAGVARPLLFVLILLAAFGCLLMTTRTAPGNSARQHLTSVLHEQKQHLSSAPAPHTLAQRKEHLCGPSPLTIVIPAYIDHMPQLHNYFQSVLDNVTDSSELRWHLMLSNTTERLYAQQLLQPLQFHNVSDNTMQHQQQQQRLNITYSDIWTTLEEDGSLKAAKITQPEQLEAR